MKKIAFFVQHMLCGGVENALYNLSKELVENGHDVTIYVISKTGEFIDKIPEGVKLKKLEIPKHIEKFLPVGGIKLALKNKLNNKKIYDALVMLLREMCYRPDFSETNVNFDSIPNLSEQFDIAVCYHIHSPFLVKYVSEKVNSKKKLAWIHNDFKTTEYEIEKLKKYVEKYDKFYCVAKQLRDEFLDIFPEYDKKTFISYNIVPVTEIKQKGNEYTPKEYKDNFNKIPLLLSVGRLEKRKGYDLSIKVCKMLKQKGYKFKWFILGEGSERDSLEKMIKKYDLEDFIFLLGIRTNPYPYFKNCDIYIQTSRHEGYVTTVTEAKIFNKPIITTDVSGAKEQIVNGENGYIVNFSEQEVYEKIASLLDNENIQNEMSRKLKKTNWIENSEICKLFVN